MQIVLLSGGSGKRLWPLSNEIRSKQFIKIFSSVNNDYESMLQKVIRQIRQISGDISILVSTSKSQESILKKYVAQDVEISCEPCRRNTFPAIALTAAYLRDVKKISANEPIIICPVDSYVNDDFFKSFETMEELAKNSAVNLVLIGINPTYPSEKYGYIIPKSKDKISEVLEFKEKPTAQVAEKYIEQGGLWNGGVFACKISFILEKAREILKTDSYFEIFKRYSELPNISIDYAVVEKEKNIKVVRYNGDWKDVGTWNTLSEVMQETSIGKVQIDSTCRNSNIINETDMPIIAMGLQNIIVAASPDGILVADKFQSSFLRPFVENLHEQIKFAEKSYGTYTVIDIDENSLTIKVILNAGAKMRYHSHEYRDEIWMIVKGEGQTVIDDKIQSVKAGDIIKIPCGVKHTIKAKTDLKIIEIQLGKNINVEDKILWE